MCSIPQKAPIETTEIERPHDAAELRSLPCDEQARLRQDFLNRGMRYVRVAISRGGKRPRKSVFR